MQIEVRWSAGDPTRMEAYATDLVGLFKPDVVLTSTTGNLAALQRATRTIPIVFTGVSDPVEQGFVPNLTQPGSNITGFANPEFSVAGKWADLLKQMARAGCACLQPRSVPAVQAVSERHRSRWTLARRRGEGGARPQHGRARGDACALVTRTGQRADFSTEHFQPLARQADRRDRGARSAAGDLCAGRIHGRRRSHALLQRCLGTVPAGALLHRSHPQRRQPGDLSVQLPTKYRFIVNRKTASALGIDVPLGLLLAADEVIE